MLLRPLILGLGGGGQDIGDYTVGHAGQPREDFPQGLGWTDATDTFNDGVNDGSGKAASVQTATHLVKFAMTGPGKIAGVGNGDSTCREVFQAIRHSAFHGHCLASVQSVPGQSGKFRPPDQREWIGRCFN